MIALALDGALGTFSVAVSRSDGESAEWMTAPNRALEEGLAIVGQALQAQQLAPSQLDCIASGVGPGSFTGTRIAVSYAKSLAQAWSLPLCGVSSFDALEAAAKPDPAEPLLTVVRGRPGVVSVRLIAGGSQRRASGTPRQIFDALGPHLNLPSLQMAGDAEDVLAEAGERGLHVRVLNRSLESAATAIARIALRRAPLGSIHELRADYGELPPTRAPGP